MSLFIPVLPQAVFESTTRAHERAFREAIDIVLKNEEIAKAIAPLKSNGQVRGNKILDDDRAVETIIKMAPAEWVSALATDEVTDFRKIQIFNGVLRKYFVVDSKTGKLTGEQAPAYLKRIARAKTQAEATQPAAQ